MENNAPQKKQLPAFLILTIIAMVAAVVLALTNMVTAGPIAEHAMAALKDAFSAVMPADGYEEMTVPADYDVSSLYAAKNEAGEIIGYCVTASANGYGGPVAVTLGVDTQGVVTGCVVGDTNFAETPGYGMRAKDAAFQDQFPGISAIDGGSFEALSSATMTSEAVRASVNKGLKCVAEVALGKTPAVDPLVVFGEPAEKPAQNAAPTGEVLTASAPGFNGADVGVNVTLNGDGTIATLTLDLSQQLPPVCDLCNGEEFLGQFIGKKGPFEGVDVVTGATYTSEGVIAALNTLFATGETLTASAPGFNGADVGVTATLNSDGTIASLILDLSQQLPPVCDLCNGEEFLGQFIGKKGPFEGVDVVTGATYTSEGVIAALNKMFTEAPAASPVTVLTEGENATVGVNAEGAAVVDAADGYTGELNVNLTVEDGKVTSGEFVAPAPAAGETFTGKAQGYQSEVVVTLTADAGVITSIEVNSQGETNGFGTRCGEDAAFLNQFVGKSAPLTLGENVDALSGATVTSTAVVKAVNSALGADVQVEEAPADVAASATASATAATEEPAADVLTGKAQGYQSEVVVTLTADAGVITSIEVNSQGETNGFGTRCGEDAAFLNQFVGKSAPLTLGENVDALSGATVTSTAVVKAVNSALGADVQVEEAPADVAASATASATAAAEEPAAEEAAAPAAGVITGKAQGFMSEVVVNVIVNEAGEITGLSVNSANETEGYGTRCGEDAAFLNQFVGKSAPLTLGENVDALSGATVTSTAVVKAVNSALDADVQVEEAPADVAASATAAATAATENVQVEEAPADTTASATASATAATEESAAEEAAPAAANVLTGKAQGYQSEVTVNVIVNEANEIVALSVNSQGETNGFGTRCGQDAAFLNQFLGKKATPDLGEGIDALSGATVTSTAVVNAINNALGVDVAVVEVSADTTASATASATAATEEPAAEEAAAPAAGEVLTGKAQGYQSEVAVNVIFNEAGEIVGLSVNSAGETNGFGTRCAEDAAFLNQFMGKAAPLTLGEGIDALSGATVTSTAVVNAINAAIGQ